MTENKISSPSLKQNTVDMANRHRRRHRHMSSHDRLNSDRRAKNILNQFSGASVVGFARIASSDKLDHLEMWKDILFNIKMLQFIFVHGLVFCSLVSALEGDWNLGHTLGSNGKCIITISLRVHCILQHNHNHHGPPSKYRWHPQIIY